MTGDMTMKNYLLILCLLFCFTTFAAVKPINSQKIVLRPGWNLVTLERPVIAADAERFLALKPMTLDPARKSYVYCTSKDSIKIGTGYWIYSKTAQTIEMRRDTNQTAWETAALTKGWNLVGVADNSTWQDQATDIWQWLNGKFKRVSNDELVAGKAYFVR
jgi:hypothetical protein